LRFEIGLGGGELFYGDADAGPVFAGTHCVALDGFDSEIL